MTKHTFRHFGGGENQRAGCMHSGQAPPYSLTLALSASWDSPPDRFRWIAEHGFALEYSLNPEALNLLPRHIAPFLDPGIPVRYHAPFFDYEIGHRDPAVAECAMGIHMAALESIQGWGEQVLTIHAGFNGNDQIDAGRVIENLSRLVEYASGLGIIICLENLRTGFASLRV